MGEALEALTVFSQNNQELWGVGDRWRGEQSTQGGPPNVTYDPRYTVTKSINMVT